MNIKFNAVILLVMKFNINKLYVSHLLIPLRCLVGQVKLSD